MPDEFDIELDEGKTQVPAKPPEQSVQKSGRKAEAIVEDLKKQLKEKTSELEKVSKQLDVAEKRIGLLELTPKQTGLAEASFNELLVELKNRSLSEREEKLLERFEAEKKEFIRIFGTPEGDNKFKAYMQEEIEGKLVAMARKTKAAKK